MYYNSLRTLIVTSLITVLSVIFMVAVSASAEETVNPPTTPVAPTLSGLHVLGDKGDDLDVRIEDNLQIDGSLNADGGLEIGSNYLDPKTTFSQVGSELVVMGASDILVKSVLSAWGEKLKVLGQLIVYNSEYNSDVDGKGGGSVIIGTPDSAHIALDDNELASYGKSLHINKDSAQNVYFGDTNPIDVSINGNLKNIKGDLQLVDRTVIESNQDSKIYSKSNKKATGWSLRIGPDLYNSLLLDKNEIMSVGGPLHLNYNAYEDVRIGNTGTESDLDVYGDITANKITADEIGKFYLKPSQGSTSKYKKTIYGDALEKVEFGCNDNEIVLQCGYSMLEQLYSSSLGWAPNSTIVSEENVLVRSVEIKNVGNKQQCEYWVKNKDELAIYFYPQVVCFDPQG